MEYKIDWQDQAVENLHSIREYLEEKASVDVADKILGEIFDGVETSTYFTVLSKKII